MSFRTPHTDRLTEWVRDHARTVRGYLMAMLHDSHAADDLTQEVFCRAWQARHRYEEQGKPRAYLLRIADRLACDRARRGGREAPVDPAYWNRVEPLALEEEPLTIVLQTENRQQLTAALAALSPIQQRTLLLRYFGELEFTEIARILDCPTNTALSHARRGLEALRRLIVEKSTSE